MKDKNLLDHIRCPECKGSLLLRENDFYCRSCRRSYSVIEKNIIGMLPDVLPEDIKLSLEKWKKLYRESLRSKTYEEEKKEHDRKELRDTLDQIFRYYHFQQGDVYLEIGCGPMFLGQELAKRGLNVIGIDFSLSALRIAKKMFEEEGIKNYLLILGDMNEIPLKANSIDLIYGGGVIEHFRNTKRSINEMYRVLIREGICFNTVPQLNLGALTYRQIWGNIPEFPVLRQIAEFVHIKLLRGRHMKFGYELSFTKRRIRNLFKEAGFNKTEVESFRCYLPFVHLRLPILKKLAREIARYELFNPMILVAAQK